ncbi:MAG: hypothetical protein HYZ51_00360, partial [Candidatus Doudnabacteria bacterium]|nr:hypothetical protein [Candidatus Doudnabacteria bacterium]
MRILFLDPWQMYEVGGGTYKLVYDPASDDYVPVTTWVDSPNLLIRPVQILEYHARQSVNLGDFTVEEPFGAFYQALGHVVETISNRPLG